MLLHHLLNSQTTHYTLPAHDESNPVGNFFPNVGICMNFMHEVYSEKAKWTLCKIKLTRNIFLLNYTIDVHNYNWVVFFNLTLLCRVYYYVYAGTHLTCTIFYKPMHVLSILLQCDLLGIFS